MARAPIEVRTNLPAVLADLAKIDKKLMTGLRASVRDASRIVISEQQSILASENPSSVAGVVYTRPMPSRRGGVRSGSRARTHGGARIAMVIAKRAGGKGSGTRAEISAGLKASVPTARAKAGTSVRIVTSTGQPSKAFNARMFRHKVFSTSWPSNPPRQRGTRYFSRGIAAGGSKMRRSVQALVIEAQRTVRQNPPIT